MVIIDTDDNVSSHLANLKARGVTVVGRYYSSSAWKRITKQEAADISAAGMKIFVVFQNNGDPTLDVETGLNHAQIAVAQAKMIGQPQGSAIYFALEHLPDGYKKKHIKGVKDYISGVRQGLNGRYLTGVYSDGVVCDALLTAGLCDFAWLSASRAFEGSKEFYASGRWHLAQDPKTDQNWDGLSIDINEAKGEFGAFQTSAPARLDASFALASDTLLSIDAEGADFATRAKMIATNEWQFFGQQTYNLDGHTDHPGHTEGEPGFYERVGRYWLEGTNTHGIDGRKHSSFWSATFISWVMRSAGAGDRFRYSIKHSVYIAQGIRDFLQKRDAAGYWTVRLTDAPPAVGDIVCWAREGGVDYDHQKDGDYAGHSDIVVAVEPQQIWIIGGNVGNSVTRRPLPVGPGGFLSSLKRGTETLFALMKNRIP